MKKNNDTQPARRNIIANNRIIGYKSLPKQPVKVSLSTFVLTIFVTTLAFAVAGFVFGYFGGIELHTQARQNVVSDIEIVSKVRR